ncbi:acyltransferase family protein [Acetobacter sp. AN02]|uniref:acyltransferase family protein n=1 Tax=Acetobacter sp. AN02 TaxID=2894186 RepID=UPI00243464B6|nr:acyltransferase family protein [Acetobacter sp. AN02]MDG6095331.1 acyltransferase family protein [Acetobacter sp. AN02]
MFFAISGFLITSGAEKRFGSLRGIGVGAFLRLRAARILPCLLILLPVATLLSLTGLPIFLSRAEETGAPVSFWLVNGAALTFTMNVLIGRLGWVNYLLGVLWSLSVEEVFYLAFPLLCRGLRRTALIVAFMLAIIAAGPVWWLYHQGDEGGFLYAYLASSDGIATGCCAALLARRYPLQGGWVRLLRPVVCAGMAALYLWKSIYVTNIWGVTLMAAGTAFLLWTGETLPQAGVVHRSIMIRAVTWCGRRSYNTNSGMP